MAKDWLAKFALLFWALNAFFLAFGVELDCDKFPIPLLLFNIVIPVMFSLMLHFKDDKNT